MFLRQIIEAFLVRTDPASSMVKPAHIHMTKAPQIRNAKVLSTNWVSLSTPAAWATCGQVKNANTGRSKAPATVAVRYRRNGKVIEYHMFDLVSLNEVIGRQRR